MSKTQIFVQQADGTAREVEIASGGVLLLNTDEHLLIAASSDQAQVETGAPGEVIINLEGVGEFTVESAQEIPEQIALAPEIIGIKPLPTIVFEPIHTDLSDDTPTHEPLGVHQARVDSTAFLDRQTGEDFGMGQLLDMAEFSGMAGEGLAGREGADETDEDDMLADSLDDGLSGDPGQDQRDLPPVIDLNKTLLVDDEATESLTGHLRATDRESGPEDLQFRISQGPVYGVLLIDGQEEVDATRVTFTQADLDSGRVSFHFDFDPLAQNKVLAIEGDTFVFTVTDGAHTTGPATFRIQNTTVQIWGTDNTDGTVGDDLTKAKVDFNRDGVKFHVYGFKGDDTLRGGSGADTLEGDTGQDCADYSDSDGWVNVDLTKGDTAQSGGDERNHAAGDVLKGIEDVLGSRSNDVIKGDDKSNRLWGGDGDDSMYGGSGNDTIMGGSGNDTIYSGSGLDYIWGGDGDDSLVGGNDTYGDQLIGGWGNDTLDASRDQSLWGVGDGAGSNACSTLVGGTGADMLIGNGRNTSASYELTGHADHTPNYGPGVYLDLFRQGKDEEGNWLAQIDPFGRETDAVGDTLTGIVHAVGTYADDTIIGNHQNNELYGMDGNDLLIGGEGNDELWGGSGNDSLAGGTGADSLNGGAGDDTIRGGEDGNDTLMGGDGNDKLYANTWYFNSTLDGGSGDDSLYGGGADDFLTGGGGNDSLNGGSGQDSLMGGDGNDSLYGGDDDSDDTLDGGDGDDSLNGGVGHDSLVGGDGNDSLYGGDDDSDDTLDGGSGDDFLYGGVGHDSLMGGKGNDFLQGDRYSLIAKTGDDTLDGGEGNDSILGGSGHDLIIGGAGADTLNGWNGVDTADYSGSDASVMVNLGLGTGRSGHAEGDVLVAIENVVGSKHEDTLFGGDAHNTFFMGANLTNEDRIDGGAGFDHLFYTYNVEDPNAAHALDNVSNVEKIVLGDAATTIITKNGFAYSNYYTNTGVHIDASSLTNGHDLNLDASADMFSTFMSRYIVTGGAGNDTMIGWAGANSFEGGAGNDSLVGGVRNDNLVGGAGEDTLVGGAGNDSFMGGAGDIIDGGNGFDLLWSEDAHLNITSSTSISGIERILLEGDATRLTLSGDAILSNGAIDPLNSGMKALVVTGDAGDVVAFSDDTWSWAVTGNNQTIEGRTYTVYEGVKDTETVRLYVQVGMTVESATTQAGSDGDEVQGSVSFSATGASSVEIHGSGDEQIMIEPRAVITSDVVADDPNSSHELVAFWDPSFDYDENMPGTEGPGYSSEEYFRDVIANDESGYVIYGDTWCGTNNSDLMTGSVADDYMNGWGGNDTLIGGAGNDTLLGGDGDDLLVGGLGDLVHGGSGFDTFRLEDHAGTGSALDLTAMNDAGRITGIEAIDISGDSDDANTLTLTASDVLGTTGGADTLWVRGDGNDTVTTTDKGWTHVGVEIGTDGQQYNHYSGYAGSTLVNLMIDADLANQNVVHA